MTTIIPFIQPLIRCSNNNEKKVIGGEVLLRMPHLHSARPLELEEMFFSSLDFSYNSITEQLLAGVYLELRQFHTKTKKVSRQQDVEEQLILSFNIHPKQVSDTRLSELIDIYCPLYNDFGIKICLELIEWSPTIFDDDFLSGLDRLKSNSVLIALDDYGCSYSNLSTLMGLCDKIDIVKFNDVILNYTKNSKSAKLILKSLSQILQSIGIRTVIENIATAEVESSALDIGFDIHQGYLYGKPAQCDVFIHRFLF